MTHVLDSSALLAHYLLESGKERVQELFDGNDCSVGVSVLTLYEFELKLHQIGVDALSRRQIMASYRTFLAEVVQVDESIRSEAIKLRIAASARIATVDVLIAATASEKGAVLVHRDPHFSSIPAFMLQQEMLPPK
jgi:predicted nucleic acid-binding protein